MNDKEYRYRAIMNYFKNNYEMLFDNNEECMVKANEFSKYKDGIERAIAWANSELKKSKVKKPSDKKGYTDLSQTAETISKADGPNNVNNIYNENQKPNMFNRLFGMNKDRYHEYKNVGNVLLGD